MGRQWPAAGLGALSVTVNAWDLLKEVAIVFITSTIVGESESRLVVSSSLQPHGSLQTRILERVAFLFSRGSSHPRDRTQVSHIAGGFLTI